MVRSAAANRPEGKGSKSFFRQYVVNPEQGYRSGKRGTETETFGAKGIRETFRNPGINVGIWRVIEVAANDNGIGRGTEMPADAQCLFGAHAGGAAHAFEHTADFPPGFAFLQIGVFND